MVESNLDVTNIQGQIIVSPNMSGDWRITKLCLWIISGLVLLIGATFSLLGLWLVFPFAGLEVIALVSLMVWVAHQCRRKQVITFEDNRIQVEKGYRTPGLSWDSELFFTRLLIYKPMYRGHLCRIFLRSKEQKLEIGEFLNEQDKKRLITELRSVISVVK